MPELIDSENVIAWLNAQIEKVQGGWLHDYGFPTNVIAALTDVKRFVKNLPTIEPEVRHGQWRIIDNDWNCWRCTCCGEEWVLNDGNPSDNGMMFCPHCGARMDGGADNGKTD